MKKWMVGVFFSLTLGAAAVEEGAFVTLSEALSPAVSAAFERNGDDCTITIRAENPFGGKIEGRFLAARGKVLEKKLTQFPATVELKGAELGSGPLRLGLEISWFRKNGTLRQREIFWGPRLAGRLGGVTEFDLDGYEKTMADHKQRILLPFELSQPGVLTVVIEDEKGNRLRNLVSGKRYPAGRQMVEWDGRDDAGRDAAPGRYRARSVNHPGLEWEFLMKFADGDEPAFKAWGPDHSDFESFASDDKYVYVAAPLSESGESTAALTPAGKVVRHYPQIHGAGAKVAYPASDGKYLYLLKDGSTYSSKDVSQRITLNIYEVDTGKIVPVNNQRTAFLFTSTYKPAVDTYNTVERNRHTKVALTGAAWCNGKLYAANRESNCLMAIAPLEGKVLETLPLPDPRALCAFNGKIYAASGRDVVELNVENKQFRTLFKLDYEPRSLSVRGDQIAISGAPDSTVRIHTLAGKAIKTIGEPGGAYAGKWRPLRMIQPTGVLLAPDGTLWTAEKRENPKRVTRWDWKNGKILYEKYGAVAYGGSSAGFDPEKPSRWFGDSCEWEVDLKKKSAKVVNVLWPETLQAGLFTPARSYHFVRYGKRIFVIGSERVTSISEYLPNGTLKMMAGISSVHSFARSLVNPSPAFRAAVDRAFPQYANDKQRYVNRAGVMWLDKNNNGVPDEDEFEFLPDKSASTDGSWGITSMGLDIRLPLRLADGSEKIMTLKPEGTRPNGVLNYSLARAQQEAKPIGDLPPGSKGGAATDSYGDLRNNVITNSDPWMLSYNESGKINWFFPNRWSNVHGSHKAPLPKPGEFQGILFALGTAPLDKQGDVVAFNGNFGRVFFITSDGMYLDALFSDFRLANTQGEDCIGGEPFGGMFQYDRVNRQYLMQNGHGSYRIYRIKNLDKVRRAEQTFEVSREQLAAARNLNPLQDAADTRNRSVTIKRWIGRDLRQLPWTLEWRNGALNTRIFAGWDDKNLYLRYWVDDPTPWVNFGKDWTTLFKTGDSVDFQFAADPAMLNKKRRDAAPGDLRLLIAPFEGKNIAVLYRFRVPGGGGSPAEFASPWRTYKADDVRRLDSAKIMLDRTGASYTVTATVPLAELGIAPAKGPFRGDFGVIYGDRDGTMNMARNYWANRETGLVNDVPGEIEPPVGNWGEIKFGE